MTQAERRLYLIRSLLNEKTEYQSLNVPRDAGEQRKLLRSLMNVRMPKVADEAFLRVQDEYLQQELADEGITDFDDLRPVSGDLYLWQGDITRLKCGAIVNAANSGMTGCYIPCHACIDNCIHTFAGVQLRQDCAALMAEQGHAEPTGQAKITKAYNLPCDYVLHTVGPIVSGRVTREDERLLASCYRSCLELAEKNSVRSIAFCCISTGVFHFPNERAAEIAVETVRRYKVETGSKIKVVFNVFKDLDKDDLRAASPVQIARLQARALTRRMLLSSARAQGLSTAAGFSRTMVSGSKRYFSDFAEKYGFHDMYMRWVLFVSVAGGVSGPIGAGISSSTAIKTRRKACTRFCSSWCGTRTILSSRRTSTTASRRRALTKSVFSTRRATTACFSAVSRAVRRRLTTRKPSARWSKRRASP